MKMYSIKDLQEQGYIEEGLYLLLRTDTMPLRITAAIPPGPVFGRCGDVEFVRLKVAPTPLGFSLVSHDWVAPFVLDTTPEIIRLIGPLEEAK